MQTPVQVIDVDPTVLERSAQASLHAAEQTITHIEAEFEGDVPNLLNTLVENGPYAYNVMVRYENELPDGTVEVRIETTREEIHEGYIYIHDNYNVLSYLSLVELRGEWYTFHEGIAGSSDRTTANSPATEGLGIALFPSGKGHGITGELLWSDLLGISAMRDRDKVQERREVILRHDRYLEALRAGDVEGVLSVLSPDSKAGIRDYAHETGTLVRLEGLEEHRSYYNDLFERYEIVSVDLLRRVAQDWYVFSETRVVVRSGDDILAFNVAEWFAPGTDGQFVARIGHGTDPAVLDGVPEFNNVKLHPHSLV
jgi:hypothetical protein